MVVSMFPQLRSRTATALLITVLLHLGAVLLAFFYAPVEPVKNRLSEHDPDAMTVQLRSMSAPVAKAAPTPAEARPPVARAEPSPPKPTPRPTPPRPRKPLVTQHAEPRRPTVRPEVAPQSPKLAPSAPAEAQPTDMMSMINAARERRRAAGIPSEPAPAPQPSEPAPAGNGEGRRSDNDIARANIQHSLSNSGNRRNASGGAFQIIHKGPRQATYIFRGWAANRSANTSQSIEVDAGPNGDVETAIVRSMMELIRKTQPGDFTWDSYRLGRVLTLSARPEDSAQLELFLKKEFFAGY